MLSSFQASGNRCRKVKEIESWRLSLSEQRDRHDFPEKKADLFKENARLRQDYLTRSELDRREWRMLILLFVKLACISND